MDMFSVSSINSTSNQLNTSGTSTGTGSLLSQSPFGVIADAVGADKLPSFLGASSSSGGGNLPTISPFDQLTQNLKNFFAPFKVGSTPDASQFQDTSKLNPFANPPGGSMTGGGSPSTGTGNPNAGGGMTGSGNPNAGGGMTGGSGNPFAGGGVTGGSGNPNAGGGVTGGSGNPFASSSNSSGNPFAGGGMSSNTSGSSQLPDYVQNLIQNYLGSNSGTDSNPFAS
ncbi:MAG: hypothetical protein H0X31_21290 [Nostocaceae cyanobacterium]|nr:hypothetical protein [Nostocaceae cyanobacterium]